MRSSSTYKLLEFPETFDRGTACDHVCALIEMRCRVEDVSMLYKQKDGREAEKSTVQARVKEGE